MTSAKIPNAATHELAAHGALKNVSLLVGAIGVYILYILLQPYLTAYEAKTAMRTACYDYVREQAEQSYGRYKPFAEKKLQARFGSVGLRLTPEQYSFAVLPHPGDGRKVICRGEAAFEIFTEWGVFADFFDLEPFRTVHRPTVVYEHIKEW